MNTSHTSFHERLTSPGIEPTGIPQPERLGIFHSGLHKPRDGQRNPSTGRRSEKHSKVGNCNDLRLERSPTSPVGGFQGTAYAACCRQELRIPNLPGWGIPRNRVRCVL
jgi:hypothetical protein